MEHVRLTFRDIKAISVIIVAEITAESPSQPDVRANSCRSILRQF
jgi:hypothetical protein